MNENEKSDGVDIIGIMNRLPHRYPMILVDRILTWEKGKSIVGLKNVTINEPFFQGHFPGRPIMPGALIIEAGAQTAAMLDLLSVDKDTDNNFLFTGIDKCRFRSQVTPGDQLIIEVDVIKVRMKIWKLSVKILVNEQACCDAVIMAAFG